MYGGIIHRALQYYTAAKNKWEPPAGHLNAKHLQISRLKPPEKRFKASNNGGQLHKGNEVDSWSAFIFIAAFLFFSFLFFSIIRHKTAGFPFVMLIALPVAFAPLHHSFIQI